jgi:hypothetical protein
MAFAYDTYGNPYWYPDNPSEDKDKSMTVYKVTSEAPFLNNWILLVIAILIYLLYKGR